MLLYDGSYREPRVPPPVTKQTDCPSIPIADLYANCIYPVGYEIPYTVSESLYIHVLALSIIQLSFLVVCLSFFILTG